MTAVAPAKPSTLGRFAPAAVGFGSLVVMLLAAEALIRAGWISQYIVPPPSEIVGSFGRLFLEEHIVRRFF